MSFLALIILTIAGLIKPSDLANLGPRPYPLGLSILGPWALKGKESKSWCKEWCHPNQRSHRSSGSWAFRLYYPKLFDRLTLTKTKFWSFHLFFWSFQIHVLYLFIWQPSMKACRICLLKSHWLCHQFLHYCFLPLLSTNFLLLQLQIQQFLQMSCAPPHWEAKLTLSLW